MKNKIAKIIQDGVVSGDSSWDEIAINVLLTMREPTDYMVNNTEGFSDDVIAAYQQMIDAALKE